MTEEKPPDAPPDSQAGFELTDEGLERLLKRAIRNTLILGLTPAAIVLFVSGWRNAAMLLSGTAISAASILEWRRLIRLINAKLDKKKSPKSGMVAAIFFVFRLTIFAAVIYVSLKCFRGSVLAVFYGLSLAVATLGWEALRLLRE
jgi:hypothetical protein